MTNPFDAKNKSELPQNPGPDWKPPSWVSGPDLKPDLKPGGPDAEQLPVEERKSKLVLTLKATKRLAKKVEELTPAELAFVEMEVIRNDRPEGDIPVRREDPDPYWAARRAYHLALNAEKDDVPVIDAGLPGPPDHAGPPEHAGPPVLETKILGTKEEKKA
jgi:hypothetical protein